MKRILCSALALVLALSLCACGESGGDTGPTYPAAFAGLEDQIDAAREEGRLTVCVSGDEPFLAAACEKFEELFDISVTVRTAEPDALPNSSGTDVWYGGDEALCRALSESGGLMAYTPEAASALIDPGYGHEDYCIISADALGIMVNSDVLTRMGISAPRTWDDLLEPVYRELVWLPAYDTVEERYAPKLAEKLAALAKAEKAEQIVVGLPRNMDGSYGYRCDACRRLGDLLSELTGLPVMYQDERLTTVLAYDLLSAGNVHGKKSKKQVDAVSASVILQSYLDSHR